MDVDVQRLVRDRQARDPRLLRRLPQRGVPQRDVVVLAVAAELEPASDPRVQGEQRPLAVRVEDQCGGREVPRPARP